MILASTVLLSLCLLVQDRPSHPTPADRGAALARALPAEKLKVYLEYDGLEGHARAWQATAAHELLKRTAAGPMIADLAVQVAQAVIQSTPDAALTAPEALAALEHALKRGFAVAVYQGEVSILVVRGAGTENGRAVVEKLLRLVVARWREKVPDPILTRGRSVILIPPEPGMNVKGPEPSFLQNAMFLRLATEPDSRLAWWAEGDQLVIILGPQRGQVDAVLDALEGKRPSMVDHPARVALRAERGLEGFEATGLFYTAPLKEFAASTADLPAVPAAIPTTPPEPAKPAALEQLGRVCGRWGFQDRALVMDVHIEIPAPRKGTLAILDQPAFRRDQIPPVPDGSRSFAVVALDPVRSMDPLLALAEAVDARTRITLEQTERTLNVATGMNLREELLAQLGTTWLCYEPAETQENGETEIPAPVVLATLKDRAAFTKALDTLAERFNRALREAEDAQGNGIEPVLQLKRLAESEEGYVLEAPKGLSLLFDHGLQPTILVGQRLVALATSTAEARKAMAAERQGTPRWRPENDLAKAVGQLPERLVFLAVGQTRGSATSVTKLPDIVQTVANWHDLSEHKDSAWSFLPMLGLPLPGHFRARVDPGRIPDTKTVEKYLFPSLCAASVDVRGLRVIVREALPFDSMKGNSVVVKWETVSGKKPELKVMLGSRWGTFKEQR